MEFLSYFLCFFLLSIGLIYMALTVLVIKDAKNGKSCQCPICKKVDSPDAAQKKEEEVFSE